MLLRPSALMGFEMCCGSLACGEALRAVTLPPSRPEMRTAMVAHAQGDCGKHERDAKWKYKLAPARSYASNYSRARRVASRSGIVTHGLERPESVRGCPMTPGRVARESVE